MYPFTASSWTWGIAPLVHGAEQRPTPSSSYTALALQLTVLAVNRCPDDAVYPANSLLDDDGKVIEPDRAHFADTQRGVIRALVERGVI